VFTDLLVGVLIGMFVATLVILHSNLKNPLRKISERHVSGDVLRIEFSNQMGFLTRASLLRTLREAPSGSHLVLDARNTYYMDPDILDLILEFETETAPAHGVQLSLLGFKDHYDVEDRITYVDFSTREIQQEATPQQILQLLRDGNERFVTSQQIVRDPRRQVDVTATAQFPLAVVLACMDSRVATEMIFDLGLGDIFSVRLAGNIAEEEILGSLEYGCAVAGAKLLLVLGHTRCGAVSATIDLVVRGSTAVQATGCENLDTVVEPIARSVRAEMSEHAGSDTADEAFARRVSERNVHNSIADICARSPSLRKLVEQGDLLVAGGVYDVSSGRVQFLGDAGGDQPAR